MGNLLQINSLPQNVESLALHELFLPVYELSTFSLFEVKKDIVQYFSISCIWGDAHSLMHIMHLAVVR